jgi:hypothetical protein
MVSQVAALTCSFTASAVPGDLEDVLGIGDQGSALLASAVQLGFVVGALTSALFISRTGCDGQRSTASVL